MRVIAFALTLCLAAPPSLGRADQPVTTASVPASEVVATAAGAPASPAKAVSPLKRWLQDAPAANGEDDQAGVIQLLPDRRMHGEIGFGVGTGGYRDVFAAVNMPVGETGRLGVAYEEFQYGKPWRSERQRLDVGLAFGGGGHSPADCGSAIRIGDRYTQPLWVSRFRDSPLDNVDPVCIGAGAPRR